MAIRTVSNTGGNYNAAGTWVEGVTPTSADDVVFTATSGQLTVNTSSAAKSIDFTNYTNTITFNQLLTVSGNVNLGTGGYTQAGANGITVNTTATLTSNSVIWTRRFTFAGSSITYTLADNWSITGIVTFGGVTSTIINGNILNVGGNLTSSSAVIVSGTTSIVLDGTGTWSSSGGRIRNNLTINTAGTITVSGTVYYGTGTFTYTAGTVVTTGSTLDINTNTTLATNGITWNNLLLGPSSGAYTLTLTSDLALTGTLTLGRSSVATISFVLGGNNLVTSSANLVVTNSTTFTVPQNLTFVNGNVGPGATINGNQISLSGNLVGPSSSISSGTTTIVLIGTGTWSHPGNGVLRNNLTINTAGTITISGNVYYNTGTLTYTAGTAVTTGSTLNISLSTAFTTNGITWWNMSVSGSTPTLTLGNDLSVAGTLTFSASTSTTLTGNTLNISGGINVISNVIVSGTTAILFSGTGTWTHPAAGVIRNNLTINTDGTITLVNNVYYNTGTLTYTAGTVVTTGSSLAISASTTLITNGISWNNIIIAAATTLTLGNTLVVGGTLTLGFSTIFTTSGFTVGVLNLSVTGRTHQFASTQTYTVNTSISCTIATNASRVLLRSTTPGSKAIFNLSPSATQDLGFVNATDINSLGGKKIYSYRGVFSNTDNWEILPTDPIFSSSSTFII